MLIVKKADFIGTALQVSQFPKTGKVEFSFFGRSNAGKSSLINMLVNRKSLVKTGSRPGMTRAVNFFLVNDAFCLADLPGYGFARRSESESALFEQLIASYAENRPELRAIFFLIDMRREPSEVERNSVAWFEQHNIEVIITGTKSDKMSKSEIHDTVQKWSQFFNRAPELIAVTSSTKKAGKDIVLRMIEQRLR